MKFTATTAISVIALASSASGFAPIHGARGQASVAVQASAMDRLGLGNLEAEVSYSAAARVARTNVILSWR